MNIKRKKAAVSEVVAVVVLLGMSIAMYSVVQFMVFSYPFQPSTPSVNLVGSINETNVIKIGHFGGESISIDSKIIIRIGNSDETSFIAEEHLDENFSDGDNLWEIGEFITYPLSDSTSVSSDPIHVTIIDVKTNSVVMMGYIRGGSS